jgi:exosome complex component CSL4
VVYTFSFLAVVTWSIRCIPFGKIKRNFAHNINKLLLCKSRQIPMESRKLTRTPILPGDRIASIEEFEAGKNTYVSDGTVRSTAVGTRNYDFKKRLAKIDKINAPMLPKIGDIVVGYIEMLFGSMMSVRILYIDQKQSIAGFSAIASARINASGRERDRRTRIIFRAGDIIRGRIISLLNSSIHITIDEKEFGVMYALCFNCGGDTVRVNNNNIKCIECGVNEDRKLTIDYGKDTFSLIHRNGR